MKTDERAESFMNEWGKLRTRGLSLLGQLMQERDEINRKISITEAALKQMENRHAQ